MSRTKELILLVGGRGTRLRGVVSDVPKPMANVAGRPFLCWILDFAEANGIVHVVLATGYMAGAISGYFGGRWKSIDISYSKEEEPRGTGGAIGLARSQLRGETTFVANGDTYLDFDPMRLKQTAHDSDTDISVALASVPDVSRYGAALVQSGMVEGFAEKGTYGSGSINAGWYFLSKEALGVIKDRPHSFETDVLANAVAQKRVAALETSGLFIDIGIPEDFARAQELFKCLNH